MLPGAVRIRSLRMENFRGFEDETIDLDRPLTVLVGGNGAGKSSVLDAVAILATRVRMQGAYDAAATRHGFVLRPSDIRAGTAGALLEGKLLDGEFVHSFVGEEPKSYRGIGFLVPDHGGDLAVYFPFERRVAEDFEAFGLSRRVRGGAGDGVSEAGPVVTFFEWFKAREDTENQEKVKRGDLGFYDPHLQAVRAAVEQMLPGFSKLRVERNPLHLVVHKGNIEFFLDQLSAGERGLLALVADLARRLAMAFPTAADPLAQEALVLIDEVELHLHPAWQRRVLPSLRRTFPNCQFVVTTHSPQVISEVPNDAVVLLQDFKFSPPPTPTSGRDSTAILEQVMGVPERPEDVARAFDEVRDLIDDERFEEARARLEALRERVTEHDGEWLQLSTRVHVLEHFDAPDHQGA
jgi:hypothetical protein